MNRMVSAILQIPFFMVEVARISSIKNIFQIVK